MSQLEAFFDSGAIVDLILVMVLIELVVLWIYYRRTGRGVAPGLVLGMTASGVSLMMALRTALTDGPWYLVSLFLLASFAAHLIDLRLRWRS